MDIGAYEFQWPTLPLVIQGSMSNATFSVTFTNVPGMYRATILKMQGPGAARNVAGTFSEIASGRYQWLDNTVANQQFYQARWP